MGAPILIWDQDNQGSAAVADFVESTAPSDLILVRPTDALASQLSPLVREDSSQLEPVEVRRISGEDRAQTAAQLSEEAYVPGVPAVFVATGEDFPDALAAGPAAGLSGAPILLAHRDSLPGPTAAELSRLDPQRVIVLGGAEAISVGTQSAIDQAAGISSERLAGENRFQTAAKISQEFFDTGVSVYVANGNTFPDALTGGPAAGMRSGVVLLLERDSIPAATHVELKRIQPDRIVILGGTNAVSEHTERALGDYRAEVERREGAERFETAGEVAEHDFAEADTVYVASGERFPDALASVPLATRESAPVLLVAQDAIPGSTAIQLERLTPRHIVVIGGELAISRQVEQDLAHHLKEEPNPIHIEPSGGVHAFAGDDEALAAQLAARLWQRLSPRGALIASNAVGAASPALLASVAAAQLNSPLLLVGPDDMPSATRDYFEHHQVKDLLVLGSTSAVDSSEAATASQLGGKEPALASPTAVEYQPQEYGDAALLNPYKRFEAGREVLIGDQPSCYFPLVAQSSAYSPGHPATMIRTTAFDPSNCDRVVEVGGIPSVEAGDVSTRPDTRSDVPVPFFKDLWAYTAVDDFARQLNQLLLPPTSEAAVTLRTDLVNACWQASTFGATRLVRNGLTVWEERSHVRDLRAACGVAWTKIHYHVENTAFLFDATCFFTNGVGNVNVHHWPTYVEQNGIISKYVVNLSISKGRCYELLSERVAFGTGPQPIGPRN